MASALWKAVSSGIAIVAVSAAGNTWAADFPGANTGAIPDNNPGGRGVVFVVDGMTGPLDDVRLSMTLSHSYVRDLQATLISPSGIVHRFVFGRTGLAASGGSTDLGGTYVFHDAASGDWWAAAAAGGVMPPGEYRTSTAGAGTSGVRSGGCANSLTYAFNGLTSEQLNGIWTLNIADVEAPDVGVVSAATLTLHDAGESIFGNGFDRPVRGECVRAQFDYTGSNRSSYVLVRNTGGGAGGAITWYIRDNDGRPNGFEREVELGNASDFFVGGDFDGDGMWDPAVWTSGPVGRFKIKRSSRPADEPPLEVALGQTGDDPNQVGDYDGDGRYDLAVFRAGVNAGDPSFTIVRLSSTGQERILATGQNGQFASGGLDLSGDGFADVAMQRNAGGNVAEFNVFSGVNGALLSTFQHGRPTDVIVSGSHAGTARADITVVRGSGGNIVWSTRDSQSGAVAPDVIFGISASDFPLAGDFDGDGRDDHAFWRPSATPGLSIFSVRPSTAPSAPFDVPMGRNGDYPVLNTRTN